MISYVSSAGTVTSIIYAAVAASDRGYEGAPGWQQWFCSPINFLLLGSVLRLPWTFQWERDGFYASTYILRLLLFIGCIYAQLIRGNTAHPDEAID